MIAGGVAAGVAGAIANRFLSNPIMAGIGKDGVLYKVAKKTSSGEWTVTAYVPDGKFGWKRHEGKTYYASDKADAIGTYNFIMGPKGPVAMNPLRRSARRATRKAKAHPRRAVSRQSVRRNPGSEQNVINLPFRAGRKYSVAQVAKWVEAHGTPAMKKRFALSMAQYRRFHKGSLPKFITYSQYKMGSHPGISDVEFGVSEGHEWMAAYQVPKSSGKWVDRASGGRYVHAHGDSDIDVDVKKPVKLSKLPMRFHTPDGKAVGVIPSRNVKIGEWYEG